MALEIVFQVLLLSLIHIWMESFQLFPAAVAVQHTGSIQTTVGSAPHIIVAVTHDRHLMNSLACPILYLEDGKARCV